MSTFETADENAWLTDVPPWRRWPASLTMRLKHLFGIHTDLETFKADFDATGVLFAIRIVVECAVCDRPAGAP